MSPKVPFSVGGGDPSPHLARSPSGESLPKYDQTSCYNNLYVATTPTSGLLLQTEKCGLFACLCEIKYNKWFLQYLFYFILFQCAYVRTSKIK